MFGIMFDWITSNRMFIMYFYANANCNLYCIVSIGCITDVTVMSGDGYVFIVKKLFYNYHIV